MINCITEGLEITLLKTFYQILVSNLLGTVSTVSLVLGSDFIPQTLKPAPKNGGTPKEM